MAEMLKVEYDELMARAAELEVPLPMPPQQSPQPPCAISFVVDSGTQLGYSSESIRQSIDYAEEEYLLLAQSLRNAALAYEEADQVSADAIANESSGSSVTPKSTNGAAQKSGVVANSTTPPETPGYDSYYDLRQAIEDIEAPDQGPAYSKFESDWNSYSLALQSDAAMLRFRPFEYWEGESAKAVEANFEGQKKYLIQLAGTFCYQIASQAKGVVDAHKWAITEHPTSYELYITDFWYDEYGRRGDIARQNEILLWYEDLQQRSEAVLAEYYTRARLPLTLVYPSSPPDAVTINAPLQIPDNAGEIIRGALGGRAGADVGTGIENLKAPDSQLSNAGVVDKVSSLSDMASQTDTAADSYAEAAVPPPTGVPGLSMGGGVKAASFGGGGVPSASLQSSPADAESMKGGSTRPAGAGVGANPGVGGAMGGGRGGAGGGMPMGAGAGQGQGKDSKAKRYGEEEDIYTEDRPWTSSVIGVRRRNDAPE